MKKDYFILLLNCILISVFNTLFKYVCVKNSIDSFNYNSNVISGFTITSSAKVPYLKIFILSFILSLMFFALIILILKKISTISKVTSKLNNIILVFVIISILLLYFNTIISFIFLIIGFIIFIYYIYNDLNFKKNIYIICLILILYLLVLYFISF